MINPLVTLRMVRYKIILDNGASHERYVVANIIPSA